MTTQYHSEEKRANDLIIPYITLVQSSSESAKDNRAKIGEFRNSATMTMYGNETEEAEFIVLKQTESWRADVIAPGTKKKKYGFKFARNAANNDLPWEYWSDETGKIFRDAKGEVVKGGPFQWFNIKQIECVIIMIKDVHAFQAEKERLKKEGGLPDPNKSLMPAMLTFKSSGFNAGKQISTAETRLKSFGIDAPFYNYVLKMKSKKIGTEDSYFVPDVNTEKFGDIAKVLSDAERGDVARWVSQVGSANVSAQAEDAEDAPAREVKNYAPKS